MRGSFDALDGVVAVVLSTNSQEGVIIATHLVFFGLIGRRVTNPD